MIVESLNRADYLLHRPGEFALFTDHANLKFIIYLASVNVSHGSQVSPVVLVANMGYEYRIHSI